MNHNTKKNNAQYFPVFALREQLRQQAGDVTTRLSRSVARLTSCDPEPCLEYAEEVQFQQALAQRLFYLQHCRNALERSLAAKSATLRYRWPDGTITRTVFRKSGPNRVKVLGLRQPE